MRHLSNPTPALEALIKRFDSTVGITRLVDQQNRRVRPYVSECFWRSVEPRRIATWGIDPPSTSSCPASRFIEGLRSRVLFEHPQVEAARGGRGVDDGRSGR